MSNQNAILNKINSLKLIKFKFKQKNGSDLDLYWMDGGITPERLSELDPNVNMNEALGDWPGRPVWIS